MSDAVLKIGSVFDKQGIVDGMAEGVGGIQAGVAEMSTSFQEIQGIASAAMKKISEETIAAASTVTDASVRVAQATKATNDAYAEQRNALKLVRAENNDSALATRILAAAQEKARQTALDLKTAQEELARTRSAPAIAAANASVGALAQEATGLAGSQEARRMAAATLENVAAQEKLREVQQQVSVSTLSEEEKTTALAVAMERAKAAGLELSTAQKGLAEAEEVAAVEAGISSNIFVGSVQRMAIAARESLGEVRERIYEAAGSLKLSEGFSFGSLGGLGEALGIGIAVDMAGEFLDKTAEVNVELGHLAEKTGIAVDKLSGLQLIVKEMHGDFDGVSNALERMQKAQVLAVQGHKQQAQGFADIGISVEELRSLSPEELLQRIATAFANTGNTQAKAAASAAIFRDSSGSMIPVLEQQGAALGANIDKAAKMTGVTEASVQASERWTRNMADLTAKFHSFGNVLIEDVMPVVIGTLDGIGAAFQSILEPIGAALVSVAQGAYGLGKILFDATTGNWSAMVEDAKNAGSNLKSTWTTTFKDIRDAWKDTESQFHPIKIPLRAEAPDGGLPPALPNGSNKADEERLRSFEQALNEEKLLHSVSIQEEYQFWEEKLAAFTKGSTQYGTVLNRLAELATEGARKFHEAIQKLKEKPGKDSEQDQAFAKEFARGAAEMQAWLVKTGEDLTRTGERWRGYWHAVAEGQQQAARADAELEEQALEAKHAAGGISDLAYAEQLQQIHARAAAAEIKILTSELARLQEMAKNSQRDPITGNLLDPKLAEQIKQLENQIAQLQAKMKQQGFGDSQKIQNEISQPFVNAFKAIEQGWLKVQRDLILGTGNIKRDFAQMGAELVVQLAQNLEKMLAQWAIYELRTVLAHRLANAQKTASDEQSAALSDTIGAQSAFKQIFMDAKQAAAGAYKALAGIPIVGPILAPIGAGVAFAGVMALAAFEKGGVVDGPTHMAIPILAHGGERVLTAGQTQNFDRLVNNNSSTSSSRTNNVRVNQKNTFNGGKASSQRQTLAAVKAGMRNGQLSPRGA